MSKITFSIINEKVVEAIEDIANHPITLGSTKFTLIDTIALCRRDFAQKKNISENEIDSDSFGFMATIWNTVLKLYTEYEREYITKFSSDIVKNVECVASDLFKSNTMSYMSKLDFNEIEEPKECYICMQDKKIFVKGLCQHELCNECFIKYKQNNCPVCRQKMFK